MTLHHTREPLAFRHPDDVHRVSRREDVGPYLLTEGVGSGVIGPQFDEVPERLGPSLVEVALSLGG